MGMNHIAKRQANKIFFFKRESQLEEIIMEDNVVCVIATEKHTGFIKTCTSCDREDANRYAKYYRGIGYNSRIVSYEELEKILEEEKHERMNQMVFGE